MIFKFADGKEVIMRKVKLLGLMLALSLCVSACNTTKDAVNVQENGAEKTTETTAEATTAAQEQTTTAEENLAVTYPVTITDQAGRTVTFEKEPETIVSGYYISTSLLIALDLDDKMVGIEAKANKRPLYKLSAKQIIDLPSVGSAKEFDLEGCAALKPDVVILPLKLKNAAASLEELGIKTILVNPESEDLLDEMIEVIATATNTKEKAKELLTFIEDNKKSLEDATKAVAPKSVYLAGNSAFLSTAGKKMYQNDMITLAGGKNVAEEIEENYWFETSYEQVLAWNPEYIIIAADAAYSVEDVMKDAAIASCDAVVKGQVYKFPSDVEAWDSPVPSGILGSVWLTSVLNPEALAEDAANAIIEEYYEKFYDFKYNEK